MGIPVTVDSDDLQTLLFVTAAIKGVEDALKAQKQDPFAQQEKPRFTQASDRLSNAWRDAMRRRDMPQMFREPTRAEMANLHAIFVDNNRTADTVGWWRTCPIEWKPAAYPRALVSIGLVELGNRRDQIIWSDGTITQGPALPLVFARLTARGLMLLQEGPFAPRPDQQ